MKVLVISGTPGTGKTTLARLLTKKLGFKNLNLKPVIKKISEGYDKKKQCYIVDVKRLNKEIIKIIKKEKQNLIIASHLGHHLPKRYVDLCLITKCGDLKELKRRLKKRGYAKKKIKENLECEIFEVCLNEAKEGGHKVLEVETGKKLNWEKLIKKIERELYY